MESEIWMLGLPEEGSPDQNAVEEALYQEVGSVICKEIGNDGQRLFDERHFGAGNLDTYFFDFIRVRELGEEVDDRFLIMLYASQLTDGYHPRSEIFTGYDVYTFGTKVEEILEVFRGDLEEGEIPKHAIHQVSVRTGLGGGTFFHRYFPCCIEVTNKKDIERIKELVQQAVEFGIRGDIIIGTSESMKKVLARIENDNSLDFDYGDME